MKTVIIVQARMTSSRLPGKVLRSVLNKPLLEFQMERLKRVKLADGIVIATTINDTDIPIVSLCERLSILYYRGSEDDVLARYWGAAKAYQADLIVRVTSDCPVIDPGVIDSVIHFYLDNSTKYDYVSNVLVRTYPRGMDAEVFSFSALNEAFREATEQTDREHVTPFIHRQPQRYRLANVFYPEDQSQHRWTVDTLEDFELIKKIIENLYPVNPKFSLEDVLKLLKSYPEWSNINAHIEQNEDRKLTIKGDYMNEFKTEQEQFWAGEFGDDYTSRNQGLDWIASNIALFAKILSRTETVSNVIEFGANLGLNLRAIRQILPGAELSAIEINQKAVEELQRLGDIKVYHKSILDFSPDYTRDLVLAKGVLIHINPNSLPQVYDLLYHTSNRYICIAEYYNPAPVEVSYRGHTGKLFKRDFAGELLNRFNDIRLIDYGFVYHRDNKFPQDDITWFLLGKKSS